MRAGRRRQLSLGLGFCLGLTTALMAAHGHAQAQVEACVATGTMAAEPCRAWETHLSAVGTGVLVALGASLVLATIVLARSSREKAHRHLPRVGPAPVHSARRR